MFRYDPLRTGHNPFESEIGVGNVASLQEAWTADIDPSLSSPAVANGVAYVGSGNVLAVFDADGVTGCAGTSKPCTPLWTAVTADVVTSPTIANGVVYVVAGNTLHAFDADGVTGCGGTPKTCTPLWTAVPRQGEPAGPKSPVVADGIVYVGFVDTLYAFDAAGVTGCSGTPKTCTPLWTGNTHCFNIFVSMSPAAVARGVIYVACDAHDEMFGSGRLFAFDAAGTTGCSGTPKTCEPLWSAFSGAVDSSPAVADGLVYVNDFTAHGDIEPATGTLRAFDAAGVTGCSGVPKTCMPLWTAEIGPSRSSPAVAKGVVYVVVDTTLSAFDAAGTTGCSGTPKVCSPLWTASPGGSTSSSVAVANGVVYVHFNTFGPSSSIHGFDAGGTTGCSGAPKVCSPIWTANTENFGATSPAVANGVVYASTEDKLFAFNLPHVPQSASDCKNGGWRNFVDDAGRPFANQGQCVSSVVSRRT